VSEIVPYYETIQVFLGGRSVVTAFVLINAETGAEDEIMGALKRMKVVKEVYFVFGAYDIVTKIEADSMKELKEMNLRNIRRLDKVRSTLTMIAMK
jgi:DNA-binding Lrp family transcriptional regulator